MKNENHDIEYMKKKTHTQEMDMLSDRAKICLIV